MIASLLLAALTATANSKCASNFTTLLNASTQRADATKYAEAAALREGAAHVFQDCFERAKAPRNGIYPFDGVAAYLVAATLWHLSGNDQQASRNLDLAKAALSGVKIQYAHTRIDDTYIGHLDLMDKMINDRETGRWGVWR